MRIAHIYVQTGCVRRSRTPSMVLRSVVLLTTLGVRLLHVLRHIARSSQGGERIRKPRSRYSGPVYIFKCYTIHRHDLWPSIHQSAYRSIEPYVSMAANSPRRSCMGHRFASIERSQSPSIAWCMARRIAFSTTTRLARVIPLCKPRWRSV